MKQASIWDDLYKSNLKWKLEARNLPNIMKDKVVLELGVGNGKTLKAILKQHPAKVYAIDFSDEATRYCSRTFPEVKVVNGNIISMPFQDGTFDIVVCYFTLNNLLANERESAIKEILRVLKKSGALIFQDFADGDFRQSGGLNVENNTIKKKNGLICHFFSSEELEFMLRNFTDLKIESLESNPIISKRKLKRKILLAHAKK